MEFLKKAVDTLTYAEERAAATLLREQEENKHKEAVKATLATPAPTAELVTPVASLTVVNAETAEITTMKAAEVDVVERAPVIEETIIQEQREIIQPVIHREIEKTEIRHVIQPVYQEETVATQVHERALAAEYRGELNMAPNILETVKADCLVSQPTVISTTAAAQTTTVINEAIVHEIIKPHIIEEVQPVIHRTIHEPHIIHERKDIYEKIVEPPVEIVETRAPIYQKTVEVNVTTKKVEHREAF